MGSEQSSVPPKQPVQKTPMVRRGRTLGVPIVPDTTTALERPASGNNSPGTSICSDSELPYISYTVDRPIGDSPKTSAKNQRSSDGKKSILPRRQMSLPPRKPKRTRDIIVVKPPTDELLDEELQRLHDIPTFLPIMRGTLGLPGARDPEVLEGLDYRPWVRVTSRLQAHLAACAHPLAADEISIATKIKEADTEIGRLYSALVDKQRANARHAERLARAHDVAHQLARCHSLLHRADPEPCPRYTSLVSSQSATLTARRLARVHEVLDELTRCQALLNQNLLELEELNSLLPEDDCDPFLWNDKYER